MATVVLALLMLFVGGAGAQSSAPTAGTRSSAPAVGVDRGNAVGATGSKDRSTVQQSSEPNAGEVRAGSRNGDSSSASAGQLATSVRERRVLGLPVSAAIVIAGLIVLLALVAGAIIPGARRRDRARGNGTYGRR